MMPVALILAATSRIGFAILLVGKRSSHGGRPPGLRKRRQTAAALKAGPSTPPGSLIMGQRLVLAERAAVVFFQLAKNQG